jgi:hypothetical protein
VAGAQLEQKECVVDLNHKAAEELAEMVVWSENSLGYARKHGQRKLVWLCWTLLGSKSS